MYNTCFYYIYEKRGKKERVGSKGCSQLDGRLGGGGQERSLITLSRGRKWAGGREGEGGSGAGGGEGGREALLRPDSARP